METERKGDYFVNVQKIFFLWGESSLQLNFKTHHLLGLMGSNGIGKSTIVSYIRMNQKKVLRHKQASFLNQDPLRSLDKLTVSDYFNFLQYWADKHKRKKIDDWTRFELVTRFNLQEKSNTPINELSGGENQWVKIVGTFLLRADLFFLDEPTLALDTEKRTFLQDYLLRIKQTEDVSLLVIDHKKDFLWTICDEFCFFDRDLLRTSGQLGHYFAKEGLSWDRFISYWPEISR